ncbi:hypothetical protein NM688_g3736 [Phlebia brevispora]|uniref:Uncharacterized protein n=1 Tax=Phlebia brevispora TaxID=194682 RepID=A0ACC1T599_9APHY|nr:hypothetical protein NM688_g3736 [Phlebia brevispora]
MNALKTRKLEGEHEQDVVAAAFSPDGSLLATAGLDGVLCVWKTATESLPTTLLCGLEDGTVGCSQLSLTAFTAHYSPVEKLAVAGSLFASGAHEEVKIWRSGLRDDWYLVNSLDSPLEDVIADNGEHETLVTALHFVDLESGVTALAVVYMFHGLWIFDSQTCARLYAVPLKGMIADACISSDGKTLATSKIFGGIDLYAIGLNDTSYIRTLHREAMDSEGHILPVTFVKESTVLLGGTNRGMVLVWDTSQGRRLDKFSVEGKQPVTAITVNAAGYFMDQFTGTQCQPRPFRILT